MPTRPTAGVSGLSIVMLGAGFVFIMSGLKNATLSDTLRAVLKGKPIPSGASTLDQSRPQTRDMAPGPTTGKPGAVPVSLTTLSFTPGVQWGEGTVPGATDKTLATWLQSSGIPFTVSSAYRPGSTAGNGPDNHSLGRAVDCVSPTRMQDLAAWVRAHASQVTELIHSGGPGYFVKNGKVVTADFYGAATVAAHHDHVHVAS